MKTKTACSILALVLSLGIAACVQAASTVQFTASSYTVAEGAGAVTLTVQRLNETDTVVSVDYATADGTATNGLKYTAVSGTLAFGAGETNETIVVSILNEGFVEGTKTFQVTLSNPTHAVVGTPAVATVSIADNDKGLQFEFGSYRVGEGEGFILLGVARGDDGDFPVSVDYFTTDSTAINGLDYTGVTNTLFFAAGDKVQTFAVPILNDGLKESSETFRVTLSNPTNQVLGAQKIATVTIADNDAGVQFQPLNQYWIAENEGALTLTVARGNDGNDGPFTVDFATSNLTATAGTDYTATNGTLSFAQGEMVKTVTVPILYDELPEADKQFKVTLSNATGGAVLGPFATATVTILDTTGMKPHRFGGIAVQSDGSVRLTFGGGLSQRFRDYFDLYPIEVSTNLVDWTPLVTLQRTNADTRILSYTDTQATNNATRFYRTPSNHLITPFSVKPTGPYAVGVLSRLLTDPSRRNRNGISTNSSFMVSVWYPALPQAGRLPGPLQETRLAQDPFFSEQLHVNNRYPATNFVDRTPQLVGYALPGAPSATNLAPCPILLCSPQGYGWRTSFAEKAANFASHGYIVVVSDPSDGIATVFPDGTYLTLPYASWSWTEVLFNDRVRDLTFILDELTRWNADDAVFAGRLDLAKVATMGTCWGYTPAAEFCRSDPRCKAAILVSCTDALWPGGDVSPLPQLKQFGLGKPSMVVYGDYPGAAANYHWLFDHAAKDAIAFQIQGTTDGGYYAMILVQDFYSLLEPYRLATGREGARSIADYSLWFLNKYLKGSTDPMPALKDYPRVINFKQK